MGRQGGRGGRGRELGNALARAAGAKKGSTVQQEDNNDEQHPRSLSVVPERHEPRPSTASQQARKAPTPRSRPGRRNQPDYSARSISILESVYERLDQELTDPEQQRQIKMACAEWGVWVPQKKVGKSELMELLLLRWLSEADRASQ